MFTIRRNPKRTCRAFSTTICILSAFSAHIRYAYQIESNRYFELKLRQPRAAKKKSVISKQKAGRAEDELKANLDALRLKSEEDIEMEDTPIEEEERTFRIEDLPSSMDLPQKRFNAALAVGMDDKLYIYGGTFEQQGKGEMNLDDFHVIDLGKLDGVRQLWNRTVIEEEESESDEDQDEDEEMSDEEAMPTAGEIVTTEAMQIDLPTITVPVEENNEPVEETKSSFNSSYPQPLPFESLKAYYDRTAKEWVALASDRSKAGRREAFAKAEGYWWECREEVREMEEQMEESGVTQVTVAQLDRKDKRR